MRELILAVKAEAEQAIKDATDGDRYHLEQLEEHKKVRDKAYARIQQCDEALEAISSAAKHLVGNK
jgi:hypothetical protein